MKYYEQATILFERDRHRKESISMECHRITENTKRKLIQFSFLF
nr:MAG TPA: hypothetical protein [Caudoviricetes sp.]